MPDVLIFTIVQPIMFVLLFRYVFGGAIDVEGLSYPTYLMAGIIGQTAMFGSIGTGIGLSTDLSTGFVARLKSLPMSRLAVLAGRTLCDLVRNVVTMVVLLAIGYAVGFRPHDAIGVVEAVLLMLAFSFALSWLFALIALIISTPEAVQAASFPLVFPLVFASGAFVPTATMPTWLEDFAKNQPLGVVVTAVRSLFLGPDLTGRQRAFALDTTDSTATLVLKALAWIIGLLAIFATLAVRRYRSTS
jgi:ABC-2 type transport system permease protein/oleandomycin transport system permease protein